MHSARLNAIQRERYRPASAETKFNNHKKVCHQGEYDPTCYACGELKHKVEVEENGTQAG